MKKTKKTMLELLTEQSKSAINLVVTTIESLRSTNKYIDEEKQRNEEIIANIQQDNHSLDELRTGNEKIINNFEKLLQ